MSASLSTARDLLARLVAFDTTSSKSNLDLIAFVEDYLDSHGIASTRVPSPDGAKADLFATIGPQGTAASACRAIATACRSKASAGPPIPSPSRSATASSMAAAAAT